MEWEQILSELVGFVKNAAPALWAIYRRQVFVSGAESLFFSVLICATSIKLRHYSTKNSDSDDTREFGAIFAWLLFIGSALLFSNALGQFVNPDYYVIQRMLFAIGK